MAFIAGTRADGTRILTDSADMPVDDTVVWVEGTDERTTMGALNDDQVEWNLEPEPLEQPAAIGAALCGMFDRLETGIATVLAGVDFDNSDDDGEDGEDLADELAELDGDACQGCGAEGCDACHGLGYHSDDAAAVAAELASVG